MTHCYLDKLLKWIILLVLILLTTEVQGNQLRHHDRELAQVQQRRTATVPPTATIATQIQQVLNLGEDDLRSNVFIYQAPDARWYESTVFTYDAFLDGLKVMYESGVAGQYFYLGGGDDSTGNYKYGLANIAAFLAQVMKESLQYNACDENNWDLVQGRYPISNSCGQLNQSYQDYKCPVGQEFMECPVDPDMEITASTNSKWYGAPQALYCGPRSVYPTTGYWDFNYECNKPWLNPPETCDVYEGQKAGREVTDVVVPNRAGRTDVEGCCWWGRGAIQTSGVCNYGRLNYFLGKRAADEGRFSRYPTIDLCKTPDAICSSEEFPELKWVAGLFYWMDSVQTYDEGGWNYMDQLHAFVDGGMQDGNAFINAVSGIVNRGCHNPPCGTGPLDGGAERAQNFRTVLNALDHESTIQVGDPISTPAPVPAPINQPTNAPVKSPVETPTGSPMETGNDPQPTSLPVSPVAPPTFSPMNQPTNAPVATPTGSPMETGNGPQPTSSPVSPVAPPTFSPMNQPTNAPVATPTGSPMETGNGPQPTSSPVSPVAPPTFSPVTSQTTEAPLEDDVDPEPVDWDGTMCCDPGQTSMKPIPGCSMFYRCVNGEVLPNSVTPCPDGLVFDTTTSVCDWSTDCQVKACPIEPPPAQNDGITTDDSGNNNEGDGTTAQLPDNNDDSSSASRSFSMTSTKAKGIVLLFALSVLSCS